MKQIILTAVGLWLLVSPNLCSLSKLPQSLHAVSFGSAGWSSILHLNIGKSLKEKGKKSFCLWFSYCNLRTSWRFQSQQLQSVSNIKSASNIQVLSAIKQILWCSSRIQYHSIISKRLRQSSPQAIIPRARSSLERIAHSHCIRLMSRWDLFFLLQGQRLDFMSFKKDQFKWTNI